MWNKLWKWAKRRHPKKSKKWIAKKYWRTIRNDRWKFSTSRVGKNPLELLKHSEFPSGIGWIKVAELRTPYDGDEIYWSKRMGDKYLTLDPQKSRLLKKQKGKCGHCGLSFKSDDLLEKHHIQQKSKRGNNSDNNLVLVHLHCHDKIHSTK